MKLVAEPPEENSYRSNLRALPQACALSLQAQRLLEEGVQFLREGDSANAIGPLSKCLEYAPEFPAGHMYLGLAHAMNHSVYPAFDHLERATRLDPNSFSAHYLLAQFNFKLRIPQKGYAAAERALRCARAPQERRMLAQLLKEEQARKNSGIARPWFNKEFSFRSLFLMGGGVAAMIALLIIRVILAQAQ